MRPAIPAAAVARFEEHGPTHLRAIVERPELGLARPVVVDVPKHSDGDVRIEAGSFGLTFALASTSHARVKLVDGYAVYEPSPTSRIIHRVHLEGIEDYVVFDTRPAREELVYRLDASRVPGIRIVGRTLELLDATGTPQVRVAPPWVLGSDGRRVDATLDLRGCAFDGTPTAPWGRPVVSPGAHTCELHVAWDGVAYPAMVDPNWTTTGSMVEARTQHTMTMLANGKVLVVGGTSAELFDPATGTFAATGTPVEPKRLAHSATVLSSGKVLFVGGLGVSGLLASSEVYDPVAGTFAASGSIASPRRHHAAARLPSGKVLVAGGEITPANPQQPIFETAVAELFDPATGQFAATGSMTKARRFHDAIALPTGKVLIANGLSGSNSVATGVDAYDPVAGTFTAVGALVGKYGHAAATLPSGKLLFAGGNSGSNGKALATVNVFDPVTNTPSAVGPLMRARLGHSATALPSGRVLIAGGDDGIRVPLSTAEIFDPTTNAFSLTGNLATARYEHAAQLLPSGKVLIAGGWDGTNIFASAEIFNEGATGSTCTADADCGGGAPHCVDGVCCDSACTDQCTACNVSGHAGTCWPVTGTPRGNRPACAGSGDGACAGSCDGVMRAACSYPTATTTCGVTCSTDQEVDSTCDGRGTCVAAGPRQCPGFLTCDGTSKCRSTCSIDADCTVGFRCASSRCVPAADAPPGSTSSGSTSSGGTPSSGGCNASGHDGPPSGLSLAPLVLLLGLLRRRTRPSR